MLGEEKYGQPGWITVIGREVSRDTTMQSTLSHGKDFNSSECLKYKSM